MRVQLTYDRRSYYRTLRSETMKNILYLLVIGICVSSAAGFIPCVIDYTGCEQICQTYLLGQVCSCRVGFTVSPYNKKKCDDLNECLNSKICGGARCVNTPGSYRCECGSGYTNSGSTCVDINECTSSPCEHSCTNTIGGYTCSCRAGFAPSKIDFRKCVSTVQCKSGYRVGSSGQCEDINECKENNPCDHNCKNEDGAYRCSCNEGYEVSSNDFHKCSKFKICTALQDIFFVIDSSASLGVTNNNLQLKFASNIVKHFQIGPANSRFGAILFGNNPRKLFDLRDYSTTGEVTQRILNAEYLREQSTGTDKALKFIQSEKSFSTDKGGRDGAPDIVMLITDGKSTNRDNTLAIANELKRSGVNIIAVGFGTAVEKAELDLVASNTNSVFVVPDSQSLDYVEQNLSRALCQG